MSHPFGLLSEDGEDQFCPQNRPGTYGIRYTEGLTARQRLFDLFPPRTTMT
jgi:hypothetical protein